MCKELFGNTGYLIYLENYPPPKKQKTNGILTHPGISLIVTDCSAHNCPQRDTMYCAAGAGYNRAHLLNGPNSNERVTAD